jgi:hypothetical protein
MNSAMLSANRGGKSLAGQAAETKKRRVPEGKRRFVRS